MFGDVTAKDPLSPVQTVIAPLTIQKVNQQMARDETPTTPVHAIQHSRIVAARRAPRCCPGVPGMTAQFPPA